MRSCLTAFILAAALPAAATTDGAADAAVLAAGDADIQGGATYYAFLDFIGSWTDPQAALTWRLTAEQAGEPEVVLTYACAPGAGGDFVLTIGGRRLTGTTESTGSWYEYRQLNLGRVPIARGTHTVTLRAGPFKQAPMNLRAITLAPLEAPATPARPPSRVFVVPNFHPASCGWLANWSIERNYCANSYLDHLDRVRGDPAYGFAISEVNNMIAIANFEPARFEELKARLRQGRVEAVNAFFLEPTVNLSGGEALVKMGVEGLRWQQAVLGVRPRFCWAIDVTGTHEQMAQITAGLRLDALVFTRHNPTGSTLFWARSPDGTRVLTLCPGHYSDWRPVFRTPKPLGRAEVVGLAADLVKRTDPKPLTQAQIEDLLRKNPYGGVATRTPPGAPVLILGGSGDYSLAPACPAYPSAFLEQWAELCPRVQVRFAGPGRYLDAVRPLIDAGTVTIPTMQGGTRFSYDAFWIQNPRVKQWYRRCEQHLQAAEMLATAASLQGDFEYPAMDLYHAWLLMCLNMDRNTLWGAAGGMVFETPDSWDARDRFEWVERNAARIARAAAAAIGTGPEATLAFNPLNWRRTDPAAGQPMAPLALAAAAPASPPFPAAPKTTLPDAIETAFYTARIDPATGALVSLKLKPSGREVLGGPANVLVAESWARSNGNQMAVRKDRKRRAPSGDHTPRITVETGPAATIVTAQGEFGGGGPCRRTMTFTRNSPRIDFRTTLHDIPDKTCVVAEFPLAEDITEVRRGIPYGFSHGAWAKPNPALDGWTRGITPAVRWSHYTLAGGGGVALLDRGLTGRELEGRTPLIFLLNAVEKYRGYPNAWLSGKGEHTLEYALVAHDEPWAKARIPQRAWEFNCPPLTMASRADAAGESLLRTSDNVIVQAIRREGREIEVRLAECLGLTGTAEITVNLPHEAAALTDLVGGRRQPLPAGPAYTFPVRPQQIVTLRLRTSTHVPDIQPLMAWDDLVPASKREALHAHTADKGHPPAGR